MSFTKALSALVLWGISAAAVAQVGGVMMPQGSMNVQGMAQYQPSMQPGAYVAPPPQGVGEHAAYQAGGAMPCDIRGAPTRLRNGDLIPAGASPGQHN
jgi:hypothetical protein